VGTIRRDEAPEESQEREVQKAMESHREQYVEARQVRGRSSESRQRRHQEIEARQDERTGIVAHASPARYDEVNALIDQDSRSVEADRAGDQISRAKKPAVGPASTAEKGGHPHVH
jgi:hypothetical protein